MSCNKITIPEFAREQIAECQKCKYASGKKRFCSNPAFAVFGDVWIREGGRIITPKEWNKKRFQRNYAVAKELCKGQEIVDEKTFIGRRKLCAICPLEDKSECMKLINQKRKNGCASCGQWQKLVLKELKCPKGKW